MAIKIKSVCSCFFFDAVIVFLTLTSSVFLSKALLLAREHRERGYTKITKRIKGKAQERDDLLFFSFFSRGERERGISLALLSRKKMKKTETKKSLLLFWLASFLAVFSSLLSSRPTPTSHSRQNDRHQGPNRPGEVLQGKRLFRSRKERKKRGGESAARREGEAKERKGERESESEGARFF